MKKRVFLEVDAEELERWKRVDDLYFNVWTDIDTKCPECGKQVLFCACARRLASYLLSEAIEVKKDEQFFNYALRQFDANGPYWILKRGASGWVRLDRFIKEKEE